MSTKLLQAAIRLADILAAENAALATLDVAVAVALLADKRRVADQFVAAQSAPVARDQRHDIQRASQRLQALAEQNKTLLTRAMAAQSRVIALIARAVAPPAYGTVSGYGHAGRPAAFAVIARA
jgi:hypothetical protein